MESSLILFKIHTPHLINQPMILLYLQNISRIQPFFQPLLLPPQTAISITFIPTYNHTCPALIFIFLLHTLKGESYFCFPCCLSSGKQSHPYLFQELLLPLLWMPSDPVSQPPQLPTLFIALPIAGTSTTPPKTYTA